MKGMLIMKKLNQWLLSLKIEQLWRRADRMKALMYANPSPEQFKEYAIRFHILIGQARQLELLYTLRAGITVYENRNQSILTSPPSINSQRG